MITINGYPIDASLTETHTYAADVTSYPVESGATITDNVRPKPVTVEMTCIVSDSPLAAVLQERRSSDLADPSFGGVPSVEALDFMTELLSRREPVIIETALKVYTNMVITSFVPTIDKSTGKALKFTCALTQIQIVTNLRATVRVASPATPRAKKKISGPAVVLVNRPSAEDRDIVTLSGRNATWNDTSGRYEYAPDSRHPDVGDSGGPVPASDLGDYTQYDNRQTPVPPGGVAEDPSELGPDGKPVNSTYYDRASDSWRNTDGSPVTQGQLDRKRDPVTQQAVDSDAAKTPWWQPSGGLGNISPDN